MNRVDSPRDADGNYNYEVLECLDVELFNRDMSALLQGARRWSFPTTTFKKGVREYHGNRLTSGRRRTSW